MPNEAYPGKELERLEKTGWEQGEDKRGSNFHKHYDTKRWGLQKALSFFRPLGGSPNSLGSVPSAGSVLTAF